MEDIKEKTADEIIEKELGRLKLIISEKIYYKTLVKAYQSEIKEIKNKIMFDDNYCLDDVLDDLNKLLGDE